jgi:quercetin dioxygenase-like cupin family protein
MLTTCFADMHPGQRSEPISHPGDKVLYTLEGQLNVHLPDNDGEWWELVEGDTAFIPGGCRHVFFNTSDARTEFLFSVAPDYR